MADKLFELISKMYSDMNSKLDEINKKLDIKADKSDIVRIEDKLEDNSRTLFNGSTKTYERLAVIEIK